MEALFSYIDDKRDQYLDQLFTLLRQPSISSQNIGVKECADLLKRMMEKAGLTTEIMETPGQPIVYGERIVHKDAFTVLIYGHYDVQPPDPLEDWLSEPFDPTIRDGKIFARGVGDNKGQLMAQVLAIQSYLDVYGDLPVNVKCVFEGEEESTSVHLKAFVEQHKEKLMADVVYTSDGPMHPNGAPHVILGVRGIQYVELNAYGADVDNHSGNKGGVVPNPAWKLVELLQTMRDETGKILIDGFYDDIIPPTESELNLLRSLPFDLEEAKVTTSYSSLSMEGEDYYRKLAFEPTFNIAGFTSGYGGEGSKTIIPAKATLKMDMRLVVDQNPEDIFAKFKNHVEKYAPDVEVKDLGFMYPSRTSLDLPVVKSITTSVSKVYEQAPVVLPSLGGSLPDYVWTKILGLPSVVVPYANADENNHSPNENMEVELFYQGIKCTCQVLHDLGKFIEK
ncbi:MAG: M20/M25/M40 family metallo-hydrolase [Bacillus sp. (in: Bacteria)]|nr:M20/M25/M40 family metallo-hydrolase [Bacillus sp. (in: firmicutes)]